MKFQSKILLLFILSILVTLVTTTYFVFSLLKKHNALYENPVIEEAIASARENYTADRPAGSRESLFESITIINREYVKAKILKKDVLINGISSLLLFLLAQALVLLLLIFLVIKAVTSQLDRIYRGILEIRAGNTHFRLPQLRGHEFKAIGNALNRMLDKLAEKEIIIREQAKLTGWQEVSSFLSHQLKNPLTAISFAGKNIELSVGTPRQEEITATNLRIIEEETVRLNSLVNRLKELSHFPELAREKTDLLQLIHDVTARYSRQQVQFRINLPALPILLLDRQLIEQVFINLYNNSLEAAGGAGVSVSLAGEIYGSRIRLILSDSITGLSRETSGKIFMPRFTTRKGGTGLGLSFVKKILIMHGGDITAELSPVGGLIFTLDLPGGDTDA